MRRRYWILFFLIFSTTSAHAGAWTLPKNQGLAILQASYYGSNAYYDARGTRQSQPAFTKYELQPYAEYGATDWLTLGGTAYAQRVSQSAQSNWGIADPEIFARVRVYQDASRVVSFQPLIKFPSRFSGAISVRGGSKSTDIELSALYGQNLNLLSGHDWADARLGYRQRDRGLSPQWRGDVSVGLGVAHNIDIVPALHAILATNAQDDATFSEGGDLDYSLLKAELAALYHLNADQWLQASISAPIAGMQTGAGYGASLGFAQRF